MAINRAKIIEFLAKYSVISDDQNWSFLEEWMPTFSEDEKDIILIAVQQEMGRRGLKLTKH